MTADVLIVKNIEHEGPGLLQPMLDEYSITSDVIESPEDCPSPVDYRAMLVYGGSDSANDDTPKMRTELTRIREALDHRIPYLGICLGMQALVKADQGVVLKAGASKMVEDDQKEVGFIDSEGKNYEIELHRNGKDDPLFTGLPRVSKVFQLHGETVLLKESGQFMLAMGKFCLMQAVRIGTNAYGIQSHFELTPEMLDRWATEDPDLQPIGQATLRKQFAEIKDEYTKTGQRLFKNFLKIAGLVENE